MVDPRRIELLLAQCECAVIPLNYGPATPPYQYPKKNGKTRDRKSTATTIAKKTFLAFSFLFFLLMCSSIKKY